MLTVLSLGAGVQSTCLALMAEHGEIEKPDCAIFADTQWEPKAVYETLEMIEATVSFPVCRVTTGDLWQSVSSLRRTLDGQRTYLKTQIPVFTLEGLHIGKGKRHCTGDFKIRPINHQIKRLLGLKRIPPKSGVLAEVWIGISTDEAARMKPNRKKWLRNRWPLIEKGMSRTDCLEWLKDNNYPEPMRSACTFCPFRDNSSWKLLSRDEIQDVARKETELQNCYRLSTELRGIPYFHKTLKPILEVELQSRQENMFINECEGMCGL